MEQITFNAVGKYRRETLNGRSYLVVPMTSIVPGVLPGSKGPLYYPPDQISRNVSSWDDMPLTMYHPTDRMGNPAPAKHDSHTIIKHRIGRVRNSSFDGKLKHEAWFNEEKTRDADKRWGTDVYDRIINGRPIELSTGLGTTNVQAPPGYVNHKGERYDGLIATNYAPDHIAVLPNQTGACSLKDGCGVGVANEKDALGHGSDKQDGGDSSSWPDKPGMLAQMEGQSAKSKAAAKATLRADKSGDYELHLKAADKHMRAAAEHVGVGRIKEAQQHLAMADLHQSHGMSDMDRERRPRPVANEDLTEKRSFLSKLAGWLGVTNDQARHPKDGRYQSTAHAGAKQGFADTRVVESEFDPEDDDDEIEDADTDAPTKNTSGKCKCGAVLENEGDTCLNCMTKNSNPEGVNQYTATGSSPQVYKKVERDGKIFLHDGKKEHGPFESGYHANLWAHKQEKFKKESQTQTTNSEEAIMALTAEAKKAHVDFLVTNCDCWKGEHNRKVLNSLPDENLVKLKKQTETATENALVINQLREDFDADLNIVTTNAFPAFLKKKMDAKKSEDEADDSSVVDNDGGDNPSFQSVKNAKRPTLAEWEASMPPEAQQTWNHAKTIVSEETARLTSALNAIAAKETNAQRKNLIVNRLKAKPSVSDLRDLLTLVQPAPTANAQPVLNLFPSYLGAAGGFDAPTFNRDEAGDDVLNTLTMDDIVAEERARKTA